MMEINIQRKALFLETSLLFVNYLIIKQLFLSSKVIKNMDRAVESLLSPPNSETVNKPSSRYAIPFLILLDSPVIIAIGNVFDLSIGPA